MQIIYPSDYYYLNKADENYEDEFNCARQYGLKCVLLSSKHLLDSKIKLSGSLEAHEPVIWRGWMLKQKEYRALYNAVSSNSAGMLISPDDYASCHYITGWYDLCRDYTPETIFLKESDDLEEITTQLNWDSYFVKDHVKSLTTSRGSIAKNAEEIREVLRYIRQYRGEIEGGVALRKVEDLRSETERRYFSFYGTVYSSDNIIPAIVHEIAKHIRSPFFSIDMVETSSSNLRLIEIGDGQVSDIKEWDIKKFIKMIAST
ncbi:hypothetical protein EDC48_101175 [Gibbsiella quercinecans]|uniref:ATP-grasp domain-containing protein n=1 Tax=Gibbsiella quercinecans TaxID=929813 RepID=A0A250AVQ6_9GAMM|nr:ATP-grasp domain-containing protein [Gibbsiella quercinecans]ATA18048.1 hypothetical protein AWC35_01035 [Gibbsiella quercinecans]RLM06035.1 hypothetical protein BIY30_17685 [Gibbsiella quercinecans]RLM12805.1 hypothetical protein BIY31_00005 [Gibbsiella quercinecans]TCT92369.1 hypothetical protein EDC48_101175 [Gibbsiella quercinecans]